MKKPRRHRYGKQIALWIPEDLYAAIDRRRRHERIRQREIIIEACSQYLGLKREDSTVT